MTCFRARHGKMSLNSIYTSNHMIFRGVSLENVIQFHVHIKLHVCFFFFSCTHQITCLLFFLGGEGGAGHGKVIGKCFKNSMYTSNNMFFLGARHGENVIEFHIHVKLHIFRCTSWENVIKFHAHVK